SRRCGGLGRSRCRCCRGGRSGSNFGCPPNLRQLHRPFESGGRSLDRSEHREFALLKEMRIGAYLIKQKLLGRKRYPLVLMLEPLFRCNLACVGCGKIDYPDAILNRRMSAQECWDAAEECGAPMVPIPGGAPLIHQEI